ncbi:MAG: hypothetical protein HY355_03090 [Armatimonadetes bacterium]|nr:hypothetical protein [Armatimonadota bacterium]
MDEERRIEQSKVAVRWLVVVVLCAAAIYLRRSGTIDTPWVVIVGLTAVVTAANLTFSAVLRRGAPRWLRYVTTATDLVLTSLLIAYSGGSGSPFYYVYFIVLVSNSIRYGMSMAVFVAFIYNVAYVMVLLLHPVGGDLTMEGVKILAFWGVALYAGYLATRFQRQARILQSYEETIAGLRTRLDELEAAHRPQERR